MSKYEYLFQMFLQKKNYNHIKSNYRCLDNKDEMLLGLQYTKTLKIKASNEPNFEKKINCLISSWESGGIYVPTQFLLKRTRG